MSRIYPFAALRPTSSAAPSVAAVPYDVVNTDEARTLAAGHPLSFLHVSRPEIDLPAGTNPYSDSVYEKAVANFSALKAAAPLIVEDHPSFYVYRLTMGGHVQSGIAACFSLDEYDRDLIKKHEKTRPDKEDDRTRHMVAIRAQTGPVFLTYKASRDVDAVVARVVSGPSLFDFTAPDGIRHEVWRAAASEHHHITSAFARIGCLYIADGHHRAASAARARRMLHDAGVGAAGQFHECDSVMAVAFPDDQVQVLPYHRVVRDLNGLTPERFRAMLESRVRLHAGGSPSPGHKGAVGMYFERQWWTLAFPPDDGATTALDVSRLQDEVLSPLLGIHDVRTDKRIDFVGGIRGTTELQRLVDSGKFAVAFSLFPVSVEDLMRIADAGGIMPPKSTWFEPKLRDGLLSHVI